MIALIKQRKINYFISVLIAETVSSVIIKWNKLSINI